MDRENSVRFTLVKVLGIETSCDETSVAVVEMTDGGEFRLLSNVTSTSLDLHIQYGGVVPEIAARSHIEYIIPAIEKALSDALNDDGDPWQEIDAIAVTYGPGLGGSLLVGVCTARTLALLKNKSLYAVNHVLAHPMANFISSAPDDYKLPDSPLEYPMLALIVSGGHTQLVLFKSAFDYRIIGQTKDDAIGEAFDKVAKILDLPYPGGPSIEKFAVNGDPNKFIFPKARMDNPYDSSFSGLKTAILRTAQELIGEDHSFPSKDISERLSESQKADIASSFQNIACRTVVEKTVKACEEFHPKSVVIAGGVSASKELRRQLDESLPIKPTYTDIKLCTDNGAMIATTGCMMIAENIEPTDPKTLDIYPSLSM